MKSFLEYIFRLRLSNCIIHMLLDVYFFPFLEPDTISSIRLTMSSVLKEEGGKDETTIRKSEIHYQHDLFTYRIMHALSIAVFIV
jgi:hypothetical protein